MAPGPDLGTIRPWRANMYAAAGIAGKLPRVCSQPRGEMSNTVMVLSVEGQTGRGVTSPILTRPQGCDGLLSQRGGAFPTKHRVLQRTKSLHKAPVAFPTDIACPLAATVRSDESYAFSMCDVRA